MAEIHDFEELLLRLPRRESKSRGKTVVQKPGRCTINPSKMLTAVLREQRVYLKQNKYAQELEAKYWHPRIKSMEQPVQPRQPRRQSRDYPVNDPAFTLNLKQRFESADGVSVSCPRLKSAPGGMPRGVLMKRLRETKGHLMVERPVCLGLPTRVFSPSKGSLFTKYSRVSLQPRPFTTERPKRVALSGKNLSTSVIIPGQVLLDEPMVSRSMSPESRGNTSGVNTRPPSQARLPQDLPR